MFKHTLLSLLAIISLACCGCAPRQPAPPSLAGGAAVWRASFSPDGESVAAVGFDDTTRVWELPHGIFRMVLEKGEAAYDVKYLDHGRQLATAGKSGSVKIRDSTTGILKGELRTGVPGTIVEIAFSPDDRILAGALYEDSVILWDVKSRKKIATLTGHSGRVLGLCWLPDGKTLVSVGFDGRVILWDVAGRRERTHFVTDVRRCWCVAPSPDGKTLAVGGVRGAAEAGVRKASLVLIDASTGNTIMRFFDQSFVTTASFSPDGRYLLSGATDHTIRTWDVAAGTQLGQAEEPEEISCVAVSRDGKTVLTSDLKGPNKLWPFDQLANMRKR